MLDPEDPLQPNLNTRLLHGLADGRLFEGLAMLHSACGEVPELPVLSFMHKEYATSKIHNDETEAVGRDWVSCHAGSSLLLRRFERGECPFLRNRDIAQRRGYR